MIRVEHDGRPLECDRHDGGWPGEVLAHDFLLCPHLKEQCHLVLREVTPAGVITLWDCEGRGHVFGPRDSVDVARPRVVKDEDRVWPPFDQAWLDQAARAPAEELS